MAIAELRKEHAFIFRQLAQNKYYLGDVEATMADWNQAIRIDPKYASAYNGRGIAKSGLN